MPVPPFRPRRPIAQLPPVQPIRKSTLNKRQRLISRYPLCLQLCALKNAQCAAIRLRRKPLVRRLRQLKELQILRRDFESKVKKLQDVQGKMMLARIAATMVHNISYTDPHPPPLDLFDGHAYWWNWKGVKLRFTGFSSRRFQLAFDFSSYASSCQYVEIHAR